MKWLITALLLLFLTSESGLAADRSPLFERANLLYSLEERERANEQLERLLRSNPRHAGALALRGFIAVDQGHRDQAEKMLDRLASSAPDSSYTKALRQLLESLAARSQAVHTARLLNKAGRADKALHEWRNAYPEGLAPGPLAREYASVLVAAKKQKEAREIFTQLVNAYPGNLQYQLDLARLDADDPNTRANALHTFGELTRYRRFEDEARDAWSRLVRQIEQPALAVPAVKEYLQRYPQDQEMLAYLETLRKGLAESPSKTPKTLLPKGPEKTRDRTPPALAQARELIDRGRYQRARSLLDSVLKKNPKQGEALGYLGLIALRNGNHHLAERLFRKAAQQDIEDRQGKWQSLYRTARYWGLLADAEKDLTQGRIKEAKARLTEAIRIDPKEATGLARMGELLRGQGKTEEAASWYRRALSLESDNWDALHGLALLKVQRNAIEAIRFLEHLTPRQKSRLGTEYSRLLASALRDRADQQLNANDRQGAVRTLRRAVRIAPSNPWVRYDLARLLPADEAVRLFREGVSLTPEDPEMRYAYALYLSSSNREAQALAQIDAIPEKHLTDKYRAFRGRLLVALARREALDLYRNQQLDKATKRLAEAENPDILAFPEAALDLVEAWRSIDRQDRATQLLDRLLHRFSNTSAGTQLQLIEALTKVSRHDEAARRIARLWQRKDLNADERDELARLDVANTLALTELLAKEGQPGKARRLLDHAIGRLPGQAPLYHARSRIAYRLGDEEAALRDALRAVELAPDELAYRLTWIEYLLQNNPERARQELSEIVSLIPPGDQETPRRLVRLLDSQGLSQTATELLRDFIEQRKLASEVFLPLAREAKDDDQALSRYALLLLGPSSDGSNSDDWANWADEAPEPLAEEVDARLATGRRTLSVALDYGSRSATDGLSTLSALRIPIKGTQPVSQGELFVHIEPTSLDAGNLDTTDPDRRAELGTNLLCTTACTSLPAHQKAKGTGFLVGYEDSHWRIDAGTTPRGFPVSYFIGALEYRDSLGTIDWRLELSQRPITSSLLSYAGAVDPNTGKAWGGVRATGVTLGVAHDVGGPWGFWANLQLHELKGKEVPSNDRLRLLAGTYYKWIREPDERLSLSLGGMAWRHSRNLGEYTWGHGGYYSPQTYLSLSAGLDWYGRTQRWSWEAKGKISRSWSRTDAAPYFPGDPALQAQAEAIAPTTGIDPHYGASSGPGTGYSIEGALEYRVNRFLHLGGRVSMERSEDYAPNRAIFYLRLTDQPSLLPPPMPPNTPLALPDY